MTQTTMQIIYQLFVLAVLITLSASRPQADIDSQESPENQPNVSELEKLYSAYRFPQYFNIDEQNNPLDRLQFQYRTFYPNSPFNGIGGGNGGSAGAGLPYWNQYRQLVTKRQTRYRQCYFNPISCFKK